MWFSEVALYCVQGVVGGGDDTRAACEAASVLDG